MGMQSGVVEKIHSKDSGAEDQFGNRFLRSFRIVGQDIWYGLGKGKTPDVNMKVGAGFHQLAEGDTISFFFEVNEFKGKEYYNVKSSKISLDKKGDGPVAQTSRPAPSNNSSSTGTQSVAASSGSFRGNELSIKSGRAVNGAMSLITSGQFNGTLEEALAKVIALEVYADANYNTLYEAAIKGAEPAEAPATVAEKPKARAKPAAKPAPEPTPDDFDDDIPF